MGMGMTLSIHADTDAEFRALQSEGAPELHISYSTALALCMTAGIDMTAEDYCVSFDPAEVDCLDVTDVTRLRVLATVRGVPFAMRDKVEVFWPSFVEVCQAARRLGKLVSGA